MATAQETANREQYLTFRLGSEAYAVAILRVREIIAYVPMTRVPMTPPYISGVINLRGSVVPVVDLAIRFGMQAAPVTRLSCIIILEVELGGEATVMGIVADTVQEVIDLSPKEVESPPEFGPRVQVEYLKGLGKIGETFVLILDIDRIFSVAEGLDLLSLREASQTEPVSAQAEAPDAQSEAQAGSHDPEQPLETPRSSSRPPSKRPRKKPD